MRLLYAPVLLCLLVPGAAQAACAPASGVMPRSFDPSATTGAQTYSNLNARIHVTIAAEQVNMLRILHGNIPPEPSELEVCDSPQKKTTCVSGNVIGINPNGSGLNTDGEVCLRSP